MNSVAATTVPASWNEPDGVPPRGTLVVLTGRGETAATYARLGRRLSADAYRVRVLETNLDDLDATRAAVRATLDEPDAVAPHVLVGTDTGAALARLLAAEDPERIVAVVLAGLPGPAGHPAAAEWESELEARTACPTHRRVLDADDRFRRGALLAPPPAALTTGPAVPRSLPMLVVHGTDDALSPVDRVAAAYAGAPKTQVALVIGGRHDVLNDVTHRSVAATIVLFLERLRLGDDLPEIVRIATVDG